MHGKVVEFSFSILVSLSLSLSLLSMFKVNITSSYVCVILIISPFTKVTRVVSLIIAVCVFHTGGVLMAAN